MTPPQPPEAPRRSVDGLGFPVILHCLKSQRSITALDDTRQSNCDEKPT